MARTKRNYPRPWGMEITVLKDLGGEDDDKGGNEGEKEGGNTEDEDGNESDNGSGGEDQDYRKYQI